MTPTISNGSNLKFSRRELLGGSFASVLGRFSAAQADPTLGAIAGTVALWLAQGAFEYVGGKIMANALGDAQISDVRTWIREAVAELEAFVSVELKRQLDAKVIEYMQDCLQGIKDNLYNYSSITDNNGQKERKYYLIYCDTTTAQLVHTALHYDQAIFIATATMAYRFFTLYALYNLDSEPGPITNDNTRTGVNEFITQVGAMRDRIAVQMSPDRRLSLQLIGPPSFGFGNYRVAIDGILVGGIFRYRNNGSDADNARWFPVAHARLLEIRANLQKQKDEFLNTANSAIRLIINTYDLMCKEVGSTYSVPSSISLEGVPDSVILKLHPFKMPGAIVK